MSKVAKQTEKLGFVSLAMQSRWVLIYCRCNGLDFVKRLRVLKVLRSISSIIFLRQWNENWGGAFVDERFFTRESFIFKMSRRLTEFSARFAWISSARFASLISFNKTFDNGDSLLSRSFAQRGKVRTERMKREGRLKLFIHWKLSLWLFESNCLTLQKFFSFLFHCARVFFLASIVEDFKTNYLWLVYRF